MDFLNFVNEQADLFKKGERIHYHIFETLIDKYGIRIPPRTKGVFRKHVHSVGIHGVEIDEGKTCNLWPYIKDLHRRL